MHIKLKSECDNFFNFIPIDFSKKVKNAVNLTSVELPTACIAYFPPLVLGAVATRVTRHNRGGRGAFGQTLYHGVFILNQLWVVTLAPLSMIDKIVLYPLL